MSQILFFGCQNGKYGHFAFAPGWRLASGREARILEKNDGKLAPKSKHGNQIEGKARVVYGIDEDGGYALLSFWDRSVDSRPGSNVIFFVHIEPNDSCDDEEILKRCKEAWPEVFARFKFEVEIVSESYSR